MVFRPCVWLLSVVLAAVGVLGVPAPAAAAAPAGVPELLSPAGGEQVTGNPVLRWAAVPSAAKYRVQVSSSPAFASLLYNTDTYGLRATPVADLPLGQLYWRVAATDGTTAGVGSYAESSFVKLAATQPTLTEPEDGAVLAYPGTAPVLRWAPAPGVGLYRVELDDAADFIGATVFTTANTSVALTDPLTLDKDYYWRVQGLSATAGVTTNFSPARRFRTTWLAADGAPVLQSPVGGTSVDVTDVAFRWHAVSGAQSYQIQVSPNEDFANNTTDDQVVKGTAYSPSTTYDNATYFWRVRALDTGSPQHPGPWSDTGVFKRSWLARPDLVSPVGGATATTARFEWTPVAHASHYELQLSADPNFSAYDAKCTTFHTSVTATVEVLPGGHATTYPPEPQPTTPTPDCEFDLGVGVRYYWRVRGLDMPAGVNGVFSAATDFFYRPASTPVLVGPADGATTAAPVLSWERLPGYSQYRVTTVKNTTGTTTTVDTYATSYTPTARLAAGVGYTWHVVGLTHADRPGLAPATADRRQFTAAAPGAAGSLDPIAADNGADHLVMPSMSWQPLAGADYYRVYSGVHDSGAFTALSGSTKLYQPAFTYATTVLAAGGYDWYVEAYDEDNALLDTSGVGTFTIADPAFTQYVSPPNCVLPDCVAEQPRTPELRWQPVDGAGSYRVWVALDKDFTNIVRGYTTEQTTLTPRESYLDNAAGQSYFWYVQPCRTPDMCGPFQGDSLVAHAQAFRKKSEPVALAGPADAAAAGDVVTLTWDDYFDTASDGVGAKQYRVQVATDPAFGSSTLVDNVTVDQTTYQAWTKSYADGVYYWRVQAVDGGGAALTYSGTRQFRKSASVPEPDPVDGATSALPTLTWSAMPYASGYGIELYRGTAADFPSGSRVLATTTKLPAYTPAEPLAVGAYSWRLRKLDPAGNPGPWSTAVATFAVAQDPPELTAPGDGADLPSNDLLFSWTRPTGAASYRFESSTSVAFGTVLERRTTVMTDWAPTAYYADGVRYHWRVSVLDGDGNVAATSATRSFVKDSAAPGVTGVTPTSGLAVDGTLTVSFDEPVRGVSTSGVVLRVAGTATGVVGTVSPAADVDTTTATFRPSAPLVPGQHYDLVVGTGITDALGNALAPSTTRVRAATAVENTSPALRQVWDTDRAAAASGGAYLSSRLAGSTVSFTFTGTSVSVLGRTSPAGGRADVYVDGVRQTTTPVSFYSRVAAYRRTMFTRSGLADGPHTLTIRATGTRAAAATSTYVEVDAFVAGGTTYQESSPAVRGGFARVTNPAASGGSYDTMAQVPDTSGAEYRFSFRGTRFTWLATKSPSGGSARVYIDNVYRGTVSQQARTTSVRTAVYRSPTLTAGVHNVRLVLTGGTVTLDAVTTLS